MVREVPRRVLIDDHPTGATPFAPVEASAVPGTGEAATAQVFIDGVETHTLRGEGIALEFVGIIEDYVGKKYARRGG